MRDQLRSHRKAALAAAAAAGGDEALAKPWPPQAQAKAAEPVAARHLVAGAAGSGKPAAARLAERLALKFRAREALHHADSAEGAVGALGSSPCIEAGSASAAGSLIGGEARRAPLPGVAKDIEKGSLSMPAEPSGKKATERREPAALRFRGSLALAFDEALVAGQKLLGAAWLAAHQWRTASARSGACAASAGRCVGSGSATSALGSFAVALLVGDYGQAPPALDASAILPRGALGREPTKAERLGLSAAQMRMTDVTLLDASLRQISGQGRLADCLHQVDRQRLLDRERGDDVA